MEQQKLTNNKEVLSFLQERYPKCFFLQGKAKPLKIGIFQDLASDLAADSSASELVSKRALRICLRHYTGSWRYLACVKEGASRVDLHGNDVEPVEAEHASHAQQQLLESKKRVADKKQQAAENAEGDDTRKSKPAPKNNASKAKKYPPKNRKQNKSKPYSSNSNNTRVSNTITKAGEQLAENMLVKGQSAVVTLGKQPMVVEICEVRKDGVSVQLKSGMIVKVQQSQLFSVA